MIACIALASALLGGCGGDPDSPPEAPVQTTAPEPRRVTAAERSAAFDSEQTIVAYCARLAASVTGEQRPPSQAREGKAFDAADRLLELASVKPAAEVQTGVDVRLFVSDVLENLEGFNCDPRLIARLEQGLASIAAP